MPESYISVWAQVSIKAYGLLLNSYAYARVRERTRF